MTEITRKLASVRRIDAIRPIPNADAIEAAVIGGWVVVVKKDEFSVGDFAVYFEIDSWVPHAVAPFLSKGKEPREFEGVKGERLRTIKLKKQLSQGLLLPLSILAEFMTAEQYTELNVNLFAYMDGQDSMDVTAVLGVQKWELPMTAQLAGVARSTYPSAVPKTDQERVQNLVKEVTAAREAGLEFDLEEKIEGTSSTFFLDKDGGFHVCSRNLSLKNDGENTYWKIAKELDIQKRMETLNLFGFAIQGEIIGPGIQGNYYGIPNFRLYVFDVYDTNTGKYLIPSERRSLIQKLGLTNVPLIAEKQTLPSVDEILALADGKSAVANKKREGIVFKQSSGGMTFKAISNDYLLSLGK